MSIIIFYNIECKVLKHLKHKCKVIRSTNIIIQL